LSATGLYKPSGAQKAARNLEAWRNIPPDHLRSKAHAVLSTINCPPHLLFSAERQQYARRSRASEEVMRDRMQEARQLVEEEKITKRELSYGVYVCVLVGVLH